MQSRTQQTKREPARLEPRLAWHALGSGVYDHLATHGAQSVVFTQIPGTQFYTSKPVNDDYASGSGWERRGTFALNGSSSPYKINEMLNKPGDEKKPVPLEVLLRRADQPGAWEVYVSKN